MKQFAVPLTIVAALVSPLTISQSAAADFSGKTITFIVAYGAGGAVDIFARMLTPHLRNHIAGKPTIVVQNMPGAASAVALNHLYNVAKKDGTAIAISVAPFVNQVLGRVRYDTAKFTWLGALNLSQVTFVHKGLGIRSVADLVKVEKQAVIGGMGANSARDLRMRAFLDSLGLSNNYKYVAGYPGTAAIRAALLRGEVNFSDEAVTVLVQELASDVKDGALVPIVQTGLARKNQRIRDPRMPDVPTAQELPQLLNRPALRDDVAYRGWNLVISMALMTYAMMMPPDTDRDAAAMLRKAFAAMEADSAFQRDATRRIGGDKVELVGGEDAQASANETAALIKNDPKAIAYLKGLAAPKK